MNTVRRQLLSTLTLLATAMSAHGQVREAVLRVLMAYAPGGVSDAAMRALAQCLEPRLGVSLVQEPVPGAGGVVALAALARTKAPDATLAFSAITPLCLAPHLGPVPYEPLSDFTPVMALFANPLMIVCHPRSGLQGLQDVMRASPQAQGALRWASSGIGTTGHLVIEILRKSSRREIVHIPYKGGAQQINDTIAGHVELLSTNLAPTQVQHVRAGRLRCLAVSGPARVADLPDVPTLAELGHPRADLQSIFGLFASARASTPWLDFVERGLQSCLSSKALEPALHDAGQQVLGGSRTQFREQIAELHARYGELLASLKT